MDLTVPPLLSKYHATPFILEQLLVADRLWPSFRAVIAPPRQAYSHCASVGRANRYPAGMRPAARSRSVNFTQNASASSRLTQYTGKSSPTPRLPLPKAAGMSPITSCHCACVTSYWPIQKGCVSVTSCCVSSSCRPNSLTGLPIVNVPGPTKTISILTSSAIGTVTFRLRASATRKPCWEPPWLG